MARVMLIPYSFLVAQKNVYSRLIGLNKHQIHCNSRRNQRADAKATPTWNYYQLVLDWPIHQTFHFSKGSDMKYTGQCQHSFLGLWAFFLSLLVLTGGVAAGEALTSLWDQLWLSSAQHLFIDLSIWETALEIIRPGSEKGWFIYFF